MKVSNLFFSIALAITVVLSGTTSGSDLFVSFSDLGGPDAATNNSATFLTGQSGSLFLWIDADTNIDTLAVGDVLLSNATVVAFVGSEVFNPDILLNVDNSDVGDRWDSFGFGNVSATGDTVSNIFGFSGGTGAGPTLSTGILMENDGSGGRTDALFDVGSNAFLFARLDFTVLGQGTVDVNPGGIFLNGNELNNFDVAGGTITVIPEPSALMVLFGATGLLAARRR